MSRRNNIRAGVGILLLLTAALIIWSLRAEEPKQTRITVIVKSDDPLVEFWQVLKDGVNEAAQEFNAQVKVLGPKSEAALDEQIKLVEASIKEKPDAIALAAIDYNRLVGAAEKIKAAGIKLLIIDSGINSTLPDSMIATDNFKAGQEVAHALIEQIKGPARIAIFNYTKDAGSLMDRERGVRSELEKHPEIQLLDTVYLDASSENAYDMTKNLLMSTSNIDGVIGLNEPTAVGAGKVIRDMGLKNKVKLIGFDSSFDEIKLLEEGVMQGTVIQRPFQMGYMGVKIAVDAVKGKRVPAVFDTGSLLITKENLYEEENQKLLFPFVKNK